MSTVEQGSESPARIFGGPRAGATVLRMMLGAQLRRFREAAGIAPDRAGYAIRASRSKISRMEHGRVSFKERDIADLLTVYGVTDEGVRAGLLLLARQANAQGWWAQYGDILPDWFEAYLGLEEAASLIRTYELQFVHGLLQTEAYARAVTMLGHSSASGGPQPDMSDVGKWNRDRDATVDHAQQVAFLELAPKGPSPDVLDGPNALVGIDHLFTDLKGHYGVPL